uniref:Uncharacterized protein n=1 Tax=Chlamydomonas leiostraca TaxID=1034604 RepID=A0A7S0R7U6_9CHLO|mmetsp:Transcript_15647/g.38968  ORF Transcript_15647/g.38968 Transcript_15647/m.38968 type:complete len:385 (+) Transcript_15647:130-1284(+)
MLSSIVRDFAQLGVCDPVRQASKRRVFVKALLSEKNDQAIAKHRKVVSLARALRMPDGQLMQLAARCPALLSFTPEAMEVTVGAISQLMGLQECQIPQLVVHDPELLLLPDRLKLNAAALQELLHPTPPAAVADLWRREPQLLALSADQAAARLAQVSSLLLCGQVEAVQAVLVHPGLMVQDLEPAQAVISGLASSTGCAPEQVALVVRRKPALLGVPLEVLQQRVSHLAALAEVSQAQVIPGGAAAHPDLLALASNLIDKKVDDAMKVGFLRTRTAFGRLLLTYPSHLLAVNGSMLYQRWRMVQALCAGPGGAKWWEQLSDMDEMDKGTLVVASLNSMARLRYLSDAQLQDDNPDLLSIVRMDEAAFRSRHSSYEKWMMTGEL